MMHNLVYINENIRILDSICLNYIEEELENFMKSCRKAAYVFSMMVAKDPSSYSKEAFEEMVVSPGEIDELTARINDRICRELQFPCDVPETDSAAVSLDDFELHQGEIKRRLERYRITNRVTKISENVITGSVSLILGDAFSSNILDYIFSRTKLGERLLSDNNHISQTKRFQKETYRHIEGVLINLKAKIRNELMTKWSQYLNENTTRVLAVI
ncbi:MAG TPA: hypothetical protein VN381_03705 [Anaerovoracaceae bacterium]|nr:hypothetical protein [Anaerovoracaceae bacterium]